MAKQQGTKQQQGIQSVEASLRVLRALTENSRAMSLKEIAAFAGMRASNTHRYLVSLTRADMVRQESSSGRYDLGPFALQLGLAALSRVESLELAGEVLAELRTEIDMPVFLSIWTPEGPTMTRWLDAGHQLRVNTRPGSRAPLLTTASGRVFLTYEDPERVRNVLAAELRTRRSRKEAQFTTMEEVEALRAEVRRHGLGRTVGERVPGINGLSTPVFDAMGALALSITSVGLEYAFPPDYDSPLAQAIRAAGARASARLGYQGPAANARNRGSARIPAA